MRILGGRATVSGELVSTGATGPVGLGRQKQARIRKPGNLLGVLHVPTFAGKGECGIAGVAGTAREEGPSTFRRKAGVFALHWQVQGE